MAFSGSIGSKLLAFLSAKDEKKRKILFVSEIPKFRCHFSNLML